MSHGTPKEQSILLELAIPHTVPIFLIVALIPLLPRRSPGAQAKQRSSLAGIFKAVDNRSRRHSRVFSTLSRSEDPLALLGVEV